MGESGAGPALRRGDSLRMSVTRASLPGSPFTPGGRSERREVRSESGEEKPRVDGVLGS